MRETPANPDTPPQSAPPTGWRTVLPPVQWLANYSWAHLSRDAVAGVTLAAYGIPVSLAYASLAGLPPEYGVYCYLVGGLFYAVFGTSRQLAIGPTSAISMLVGITVAGMAAGDPARWASISALTAVLIAVMCFLAWLLKLSSLVNFISETILLGFKAGAALTIALTQLPKLFGVKGGGEFFFERVGILAMQLPHTNLVVLAFGAAVVVVLLLGERFLPGKPVALAVVMLAVFIASIVSLEPLGFKVVGAIPQGLPAFRVPDLRLRDVDGIVPLAFACLLLSYVESVSAARALAQAHQYEIDARQELLALGAANLAAGLFHAYPVAGGLSQSSVNDQAGAKTPMALVFASIAVALCLIFLTGLLASLPTVVLAAIVLVAVKGLINLSELRHVWRVSRFEFVVSMVAFAAVLLLGILKGVIIAVLVSMVLIIRRAAHPHVAVLGRIPGSRAFSDAERHPENEPVPHTLVLRPESSLLYFNVDHVRARIREEVRKFAGPLSLVICDLSASPAMDIAGARMLAGLGDELHAAGTQMRLVGALGEARTLLRAEGLDHSVGEIDRQTSVADIVEFTIKCEGPQRQPALLRSEPV